MSALISVVAQFWLHGHLNRSILGQLVVGALPFLSLSLRTHSELLKGAILREHVRNGFLMMQQASLADCTQHGLVR